MRAIIAAWLLFATLAAAQLPPEIAPVAEAINLVAPPPAAELEWTPVIRNGTCAFVYTSPRFYRVKAEITLQGVRTDEVLLSDSLIRILRAQLKLSPCQVGMSQGTNCTSGTQQLPCSDPVFNCGQGIVISEDVYNAAINGDCAIQTANNTLVCNTIAANPAISSAVSAGSCRPACLSGSAQATQEFPVACTSYLVSIDAPDKAAALVAAASLGNTTLQNAISSSLSSYSNGLGIQLLVVNSGVEPSVGYGFFPPPPPPMVPIETPSPKPINSTAVALAAAGTLVYGPWSPCAPSCGDGYSTRTATCFAPDGTLLPLQACPGGVGTETYQQCSNSCPKAVYEYSPWSPCNTTCGGGISTREATCQAPLGEQCADQPEPTTLVCNTAPCSSYSWAMSAWSACSASCGGGNRTRTVLCVDSNGLQASYSECIGKKPRSTEQCNVAKCDFCFENTCLGRGTCAAGACTCSDGYTGLFCEIPGSCESGVIDSKLACCPSGLVNVRGECCPAGERLDADGECCGQSIDVCGVCGGNGTFVDMQGSCCTVADANGVCCPSGLIDECGVCDGVGNSCSVQLAAQVDVPANLIQSGGVLDAPLTQFFQGAMGVMGIPPESVAVTNVTTSPPTVTAGRRRRNLLQGEQGQAQPGVYTNVEQSDPPTAVPSAAPGTALPAPDGPSSLWATVSVQPSVNATGSTPFSSSYIAAELPAAAAASTDTSSGIQMPNNPYSGRSGICGNGVCEIGERSTIGAIDGSCPQDCGLPAVACIGGCGIGGNCLPSTGVCQCYVGYQGTNCADCAPGFMSNGGVCVTSVTSLQLVDASVLGPNGEALVSGEASESNTGLIAGIVVGSLVGFVVLVFIFIIVRKCLKRRCNAAEAAYGDGKNDINKPYGAVIGNSSGNVDEEIGLRQRYGIPPNARSGDGGFGSARSYTVHVDGTAGGNTSGQASARSGDGWQSARESARSGHGYQVDAAAFPQLYSNSLHYQGVSGFSSGANTSAGPMAQNAMERRSTFSLPAEAEMRASFPPAQQQGGVYYPGSARSMSAAAADAVATAAAAAPPLPSHRDHDVRASMQSISESRSHSSAVSLALSSVDLSSSSGRAPGTTTVAAGGNNALNQAAASRLFFNPAFSVEGKSGVDVNTSIAPGYITKTRPLSARCPAATTAAPMSARPYSARLNEESVQDRRKKLDALRAAVKALEQQAATKGGPPMPPDGTADFPSSSSEQQQHQQEKKFLPGRPTVPKLSLATLNAPPQQRQRRPGRPVVCQESLPESELIKSHPGPLQTMVVAPVAAPKRSSPGAALARGAKSIFKELKSFNGGSPKPAAAAAVAKPSTRPGSGSVYSTGYNAVMAKVDGALQRSAGNSPVKQPAGQGKGSARGNTGPSTGPGPSRIPSAPAAAWR